jgi:hypothetical protein
MCGQKDYLNSIRKYGATIFLDGWDNVNNFSLLNIMLVCSNWDLFLEVIDTTRDWNDA